MLAPLVILGLLAVTYATAPRAEASPTPTPPVLPPATPMAAPVHLAFAGDLAMAMGVGLNLQALAAGKPTRPGVTPGYPFTDVRDRITRADLAIGNLECVVSTRGVVSSPHTTFRAPPESIPAILDAGFDVVSIANNHAMDYGDEARLDMRSRLEQAGLPYLGVGTRTNHFEPPLIREIRGLRVGLLGMYDVPYGVAYAMVREARREVDVLVVFTHWGREDHVTPEPYQRRLGHGMIDAGADVVVGTHAHVIQPEEWYHGKLIVYGLGNFVFNGMGYDELHRTGAFLELDLDRTGLRERRVYRVRLDDEGAPRWLDDAPFPLAVVE